MRDAGKAGRIREAVWDVEGKAWDALDGLTDLMEEHQAAFMLGAGLLSIALTVGLIAALLALF